VLRDILHDKIFFEIVCYDVKTISQNFVPSSQKSFQTSSVADQADEFIDLDDPVATMFRG